MSPLLPPDGVAPLTVRVPNPLLLEAIDSVRLLVRSPPPVRPEPAEMVVLLAAAPRLFLATLGVPDPVPPLERDNGVIPEMVPPVMFTESLFCVPMVPIDAVAPEPKPRLILAWAAVVAPVPPDNIGKAEMPEMEPPVMFTDAEVCVAMLLSPRLVRASAAVAAPVPPADNGSAEIPVMVPPVILTAVASCVANVPKP